MTTTEDLMIELRPAKGTPEHHALAKAIHADALALHPTIVRSSEGVRGLTLERRGRWLTFRANARATAHTWATYFLHEGRAYLMEAGACPRWPAGGRAAINRTLAHYAAQTVR